MAKLLNAYRADPSLQNAGKIRAYVAKHPMAVCLLTAEDCAVVDAATAQK